MHHVVAGPLERLVGKGRPPESVMPWSKASPTNMDSDNTYFLVWPNEQTLLQHQHAIGRHLLSLRGPRSKPQR
jgi:hypothetical protein